MFGLWDYIQIVKICCFFLFPKEQDKGLETLSEIIRRQKQMAHAIGDEVESQNGRCFKQSFEAL